MSYFSFARLSIRAILLFTSLSLYISTVSAGVVVSHNDPINEIEQSILKDIKKSKQINDALDLLARHLPFSDNLYIVFGETPKNTLASGPHYYNNKISIPYLYVYKLRQHLNKRRHIHKQSNVDHLVFSTLIYALFHETAHALIDQHQLPIVGLEENVADNLANFLLLSYMKGGRNTLLNAALVFDIKSRSSQRAQEKHLRGEHRLLKQRYYSMLCQLYGSDPKTFQAIKKKASFSSERSKKCIIEYSKIKRGWEFFINRIKN